jgi:hypothetical protein
MSSPKGYPSTGKESRLSPEFSTIEPVREKQSALSVLSHSTVSLVGVDAVEAGSGLKAIQATAHLARRGDVIRFTSGTISGQEIKVWKTDEDSIELSEDLDQAPAPGDTFEILRHRYPKLNANGELETAASMSMAPSQYNLNGSAIEVSEDTVTNANNRPFPVKLIDGNGPLGTLANQFQTADAGALAALQGLDARLATLEGYLDGVETELAAIDTTLDAVVTAVDGLEGKQDATNAELEEVNAALINLNTLINDFSQKFEVLGQKTSANSAPVVLASDQSSIPASQSGTWNINNVSGTVSLPTGAATANKQDTGNASLSSIDGKLPTLGQQAKSGSVSVALASDQGAIVTRSENYGVVGTVRNDHSSVNVTAGAWVQLLASLSGAAHSLEIFDSSGQTLELGIGGAGAEARLLLIPPGGNGKIPAGIPNGARVAVRAVSGTANAGELDINFYG